jgi:hypothetical protein
MKAKWFVKVGSYWQGGVELFFGPYATREDAEKAADVSGAARPDKGQGARDVKNPTCIEAIYNATQARKCGLDFYNTVPASVKIPGDTVGLHCAWDEYAR